MPFITRYRKERTGNLDEVAVRRALEAKELFEKILSRQRIIVESIERHATLSPELRERILSTFDLDALEDLYHPYRQQKKNRALAAREAGLEPLADWIWGCGHGTETPQEGQTLELWAFTFRNEEKGVPDAKSAIEGARDILVERLAGTPELRALVRRAYFEHGWLRADEGGEGEAPQQVRDVLRVPGEDLVPARAGELPPLPRGAARPGGGRAPGRDRRAARRRGVRGAARGRVRGRGLHGARLPGGRGPAPRGPDRLQEQRPHLDRERGAPRAEGGGGRRRRPGLRRERAPEAARGAARPEAGARRRPRHPHRLQAGRGGRGRAGSWRPTSSTSRPTSRRPPPARRSSASPASTRRRRWRSATGRGAARPRCSRARPCGRPASTLPVVLVSEAGASVYSTSDAARAEFPDLDATVRGAISIARRLQDPLAELVKIEPRSIGVGQYQHDVAHAALQRALDAVVEDCVNGVGVDLNTASRAPPRPRGRASGPRLAGAIVEHREKQGLFRSRQQLLEVPRFGPKAFEQAAGFLRVRGGENPLDDTAVHPERYAALEALASRLGKGAGGAPRARRRARARGRGAQGGAGRLHLGGRRRRAREARAGPARGLRAVRLPRGRAEARGPEARDGLPGDREQRDELRRLRRHRRPPRRPRPRLAARGRGS